MSSYVPLYKPLKVLWLAAVLVVAGLTLWHPPAWRGLCREPGMATGQVVGIHVDHGRVRYHFQAGGRTWEGTTGGYRRDGSSRDLHAAVEVYYAPSDPSINQAERPSPGDWWRHAVAYLLFYSVFPVTLAVGMAQRFVQWLYDRTIYD